jgi:hypothetical protein
MLTFVSFVCSAGMAGAALWLYSRVRRQSHAVAALARAPGATDGLSREVARLILRAIDTRLLSSTGPAGLADVEITCREFQDPYRNLQELLNQVVKTVNARDFGDVNLLIKSLYQIQASLGIPMAELDTALRILESRLKASAKTGKSIARLEVVPPGALLDTKKMMAITHGTHVKQPLGVVAIGEDGKVLNKAKVICA